MHSMNNNIPLNQVLDSNLWYACAGGLAHIPPLNSQVYYFPQGHIESIAEKAIDFRQLPRIPSLVLCRVSSIKYLADAETDEVYAKIKLIPLRIDDCDDSHCKNEREDNSNSFAKTLTQSDANNGGGFSVPRYCAETLFPRLDYSAEPPVQTITVRDVHGEVWRFRHIYRGTPRRHLLTTGWSNFVNTKRLVAGDSVVFLRAQNGELCVGIRRAKAGIGNGPHDGFFGISGKTCDFESVANLACNGRPFEVVYHPRSSNAEFVVGASDVRNSMRVEWRRGMRFKMAFETEDSSRISWFVGTVSSARVDDPTRWPDSPWKLLQVIWDEPDLLKNVKRVNPWAVEIVPNNVPPISFHLSSKKPRILTELNIFGQCCPPLSPISPLLCRSSPDRIPSIQGARHVIQTGLLSSDCNLLTSKSRVGLSLFEFEPLDCSINNRPRPKTILTEKEEEEEEDKEPCSPLFLFGQRILTEKQILKSRRNDLENVSNGSSVIQNESFSEGEDRVVEIGRQ